MESCQLEQAIEPSATMNDLKCSSSTPSSNASFSDRAPSNSIEQTETPINKDKRKIFVLDNETRISKRVYQMITQKNC